MHAEQAQALGINLEQLVDSDLCRMPGASEQSVVEQIAGHVGMSVKRVAEVLREG